MHRNLSELLRFEKIFTTDGTDGTDEGNAEGGALPAGLLSVKSVKSVVSFLWLRPAALPLLRLLCIFAAIIFLLRLSSNARADDVITNIMSSIVSYQYPENLSGEILSNGGISQSHCQLSISRESRR